MSNYVYRYEQFVVRKTTDGGFVVVNTKSSYECHSHVKSVQAGKALCKLAAKHKLPKNNDLYFIESLIRLTNNKKYLCELNKLKNDIINNSVCESKKSKMFKEDVRREIKDGIEEYYENIDDEE
jgi:uncharacterized membrane-anchored protein YjiN (DUF445 family)